MKLTIALSVVFVLAIGVTLASPIGNQLREHRRHGNPDAYHVHRAMPRTPEIYELMTYPEMLVNDTFENDTDGRIQNRSVDEEATAPANVSEAPETDLPEVPTPVEPENATEALRSVEDDPAETSKRESESNDLGNYTSIHGNCSHCMEEFGNATSVKYVGCMCSLFTTEHPSEQEAPLTTKHFENVTCHQNVPSEETCNKHCISMAASHNELKDDNICEFIPHASSITVYLQAKLCEDNTKWTFTGVSSPAPICCHGGATVPC